MKVVFDNLANFLSISPNQTPVFAVCLPGPSWNFLPFLFLLILYSLPYMYTRVQWFWLFFTFWGITTHPWHPKGPRVWKLAKKNFQLHPWPAEIFGKNRKMRFFGLVSKFNFRSPVWQIFTIFLACFIYGILNTHTKFEVSKSKTVVTREWSRQGSKFICLQNLRSKFYLTKIFF